MKSNLITIQSHSTEGATVSLETMETFTLPPNSHTELVKCEFNTSSRLN